MLKILLIIKGKEIWLNRHAKTTFFAKNFWSAVKPLFSDKNQNLNDKLILVENDIVVTDEYEISSIFNIYFNRISASGRIY